MHLFRYTLVGLFALGLLIAGCSKNKEDVTFDVTYIADLEVEIPPAARSESFSSSTTIDPLSDENVNKYAADIKSYEVDSLVASVTELTGDVKLISGELSMYQSTTKAAWTFENLNLSVGAAIPLDNNNGQWETLKEIFSTGKIVNVKITGVTDVGDVDFTIRVTLVATVVADGN